MTGKTLEQRLDAAGAYSTVRLDLLARHLKERRGLASLRAVAGEIDVSPATLGRVESGNEPDLQTFAKLCRWLNQDPRIYLGLVRVSPEGKVLR